MDQVAHIAPSASCRSASCRPVFFRDTAGGDGRAVFLAVIDCDDEAAIARLREILPETALMRMECADLPLAALGAACKLPPALTARQRDVLRHLVAGMSNKEIGRACGISHFTVRNHVSKLLQLFDAKSRKQLRTVAVSQIH